MHLLRFILLMITPMVISAPVFGSQHQSVTVTLFEAHPPTRIIALEGPFQVLAPLNQRLPAGDYQMRVHRGQLSLRPNKTSQATSLLQGRRFILQVGHAKGLGIGPSPGLKRYYSGTVEITLNPNGTLRLINHVPIKDYVMAVVGSETHPDWPLEALKAQAVLTQTRLARYRPGDALGDSTQQEAYLGVGYIRPKVKRAVASVWGEILTYHNQPIVPYYHAVCGGQTSSGAFLSQKPLHYLHSVQCAFCRRAPLGKTLYRPIPMSEFQRVFGPGMPKITRQDNAGRPLAIQLGNGQPITGYAFWIRLGQQLGWDKAPGTRFNLSANKKQTIGVTSIGAGHGVGLCQWGAAVQARQGKSYRQILQYYFPKVRLHVPKTSTHSPASSRG